MRGMSHEKPRGAPDPRPLRVEITAVEVARDQNVLSLGVLLRFGTLLGVDCDGAGLAVRDPRCSQQGGAPGLQQGVAALSSLTHQGHRERLVAVAGSALSDEGSLDECMSRALGGQSQDVEQSEAQYCNREGTAAHCMAMMLRSFALGCRSHLWCCVVRKV